MKNKMCISGIAAVLFLAACSPKEKPGDVSPNPKTDPMAIQTPMDTSKVNTDAAHTTENSLDWYGTYEAVVPCADCPGIKTILVLNKDRTFTITEEYLERNVKNEDQGTFEWDAAGSVITLKGKDTKRMYKVGENTVTQLDLSGQPIDGPNKDLYIFKKK
ncbi:copper resistance protein NlpE [Chryseobacterium gossypii]|uniref:copper resistance protein NlpE n=1 Tax=Chryseobacterium gossypii TaxID=3231602 RepID=UPI003523793D